MAAALALLAALSFAAGTVLQQRGTLRAPASEDDASFLLQILREPVWFAGASLQAVGWVLQAAALDRGSLILVQALTTLSLVIALPLGVRLTDQRVGRSEVAAAAAVVTGIVLFLSAATPEGGTTNPPGVEWWTTGVGATGLVVLLGALGRRRRGAPRAAFLGAAAGIAFAFQAAVTKVFVGEIGDGVAALLGTWSTYALIVTALLGFVLQQSALKSGVLAPAMASSNASTLLFSVVFGITVFDESLAHGGGHRAVALLGLAIAVAGVVRLASASTPPSRRDQTTT